MNGFHFVQSVETERQDMNLRGVTDEYGNRVFLIFSNSVDAKQYVIDAGLTGECVEAVAPPAMAVEHLLSIERAGEATFYSLDQKYDRPLKAESFAEFIWRLLCLPHDEGEAASFDHGVAAPGIVEEGAAADQGWMELDQHLDDIKRVAKGNASWPDDAEVIRKACIATAATLLMRREHRAELDV
jgi:hypothetical protein